MVSAVSLVYTMSIPWYLLCSSCKGVLSPGRVFLLDQRNTSDSGGLAEAEHACAVHDARLASAEELRHAVVECSFSACTRGWLDGGFVGTTVCSNQGSALKAVDVKIENATQDNTHLDVFCVKDKGGPCGDPPAFPNTRLQGHTGFEMGDELLYSCLPGHVMPSGHSAFSLLCDSCGEWYGLVQLCSKYKTETHIDYEDKFTDHDHHLSYDTPAEEENTEEELLEQENTEEELLEEENTEQENTEEELLEEENTEQENTEEELLKQENTEEELLEEENTEQENTEEELLKQENTEQENTEEELLEEEVDTEEEEHSDQEQQEASFSVEGEEEQEEEAGGEEAAGGEEQSLGEEEQQGEEVGGGMEEEVEESTDPPVEKEEQVEEMGVSEVTEAPVSLISQKHLFWFPSEAIQEAGHVEPTHPLVTQDTHTEGDNRVRASGSELMESKKDDSQPEETKDYDSHEGHFQQPIDPVDHDDHHHDDHDDHEDDVDREHDDQRERNHYDHDGQTDPGHDESAEGEDHVVERLDHNDHDDHENYGSEDAHREAQGEHEEDDHENAGRYDDVGEHEEDQNHGAHDDHEDHEGHDRGDVTDHHDDHGHVHDHLDEDQSEHEDDRSDPNSHDHHYDDHDYDEYVIPPAGMTTGEPQNVTHEETGAKPTDSSDETWLDGYPVSQEETDADKVGGGSSEEGVELEEEEKRVVVVGVTDRTNEVELSRPTPFTGVPQVPLSPTQGANPVEQDQDQGLVGGLTPTASPDLPLSPEATASDSHSADYATPSLTSSLDDVASGNTARHSPTDSWETTDHVHPFLEHGPAPTEWTDDVIDEEERSAQHNLTRHSGEMEGEEGESEGETGETGCTGGEEDCPPPPPPSSGRGSTVAAIVVAVCAVAVAATIGAWCYRRKQQKSSMYEMNGKGQSRHGQQIEMQQKV
ncbi:sushi domain-containing protein 5 [Oncorhynchus kisutch]|uniref:sushi domain-containing protein 5 n=1 Tax=Oncorhynchus kisutch TaxID=8019 RepID=UPI0012DF3ED5|nr:sushi domain-containing protein 5-like [Oncorhynchus kisutch]